MVRFRDCIQQFCLESFEYGFWFCSIASLVFGSMGIVSNQQETHTEEKILEIGSVFDLHINKLRKGGS